MFKVSSYIDSAGEWISFRRLDQNSGNSKPDESPSDSLTSSS